MRIRYLGLLVILSVSLAGVTYASAVGKAGIEHAAVLNGMTEMWTNDEGELVIAVSALDENGQERLTDVFFLQQKEAQLVPEGRMSSALVVHRAQLRKGELLVKADDRDTVWVLSVGAAAGDFTEESVRKTLEPLVEPGAVSGKLNVEVIHGFGLGHYKLGISVDPNTPTLQDAVSSLFQQNPDPPGSGGSGDCLAGGSGANQCSITCGGVECSVSCDAGTYACCKCSNGLPSCKCR